MFACVFALTVVFAQELWEVFSRPAIEALLRGGSAARSIQGDRTPMDQFSIIWVKLPLVLSIFLTCPLVFHQVWRYTSPDNDPKMRRVALPFILCNSTMFIGGGLFGYFVVLPLGLSSHLDTISAYFVLFANATLGSGILFDLPVMIFFLAWMRSRH